jgi:hypothetical protein
MTEQEIRAVFDKLADVVCVLSETCFPWVFESVRGPTASKSQYAPLLTSEFAPDALAGSG